MVAVPILQLPSVSSLTGNEQIPLVQYGATKRASINDILFTVSGGFVPVTRTIFAGSGLSGGGTLLNNVTIAVADNGITNAMLRQAAANSVIGRAGGTAGNVADIAATNNGDVLQLSGGSLVFGPVPTSGISGFVPDSRTITTSGGLSGGGDLSANRTFIIEDTVSTAGSVGSSTAIPVLGYNARGQLTSIATAAVSVSGIGGLPDPGSNGVVARTAASTTVARTITGAGNVNVANGDGVAGNPTVTFSGILPLANGGTNADLSATTSGLLYLTGGAATTIANTATAALVTGGTGVPTYTLGTVANRLLRTDGSSIAFAQAVLTTDVSGILPAANGGTASPYSTGSGPLAARTYIFPDANATMAALGVTQTWTAPQRGSIATITASGIDIIPDFSLSNNFRVTVSGAMRLQNPTNVVGGQSGGIIFTNNGHSTANVTISGTYWVFADGTDPTFPSTSGAVSLVSYLTDTATRVIASGLGNVS